MYLLFIKIWHIFFVCFVTFEPIVDCIDLISSSFCVFHWLEVCLIYSVFVLFNYIVVNLIYTWSSHHMTGEWDKKMSKSKWRPCFLPLICSKSPAKNKALVFCTKSMNFCVPDFIICIKHKKLYAFQGYLIHDWLTDKQTDQCHVNHIVFNYFIFLTS